MIGLVVDAVIRTSRARDEWFSDLCDKKIMGHFVVLVITKKYLVLISRILLNSKTLAALKLHE